MLWVSPSFGYPSIQITNDMGIPRGGHLGIFWVGMCRPGLQIGNPVLKKFPLKLIPRSRIRRSKSGASKSRPRWAAHTRIGNVWEYPPGVSAVTAR